MDCDPGLSNVSVNPLVNLLEFTRRMDYRVVTSLNWGLEMMVLRKRLLLHGQVRKYTAFHDASIDVLELK
jgi:hypothetical protein